MQFAVAVAGEAVGNRADTERGCVQQAALSPYGIVDLIEDFVAPGKTGRQRDRACAPPLVQLAGEQ